MRQIGEGQRIEDARNWPAIQPIDEGGSIGVGGVTNVVRPAQFDGSGRGVGEHRSVGAQRKRNASGKGGDQATDVRSMRLMADQPAVQAL